MVIVENREPVKVFLRIRPELTEFDKENKDSGDAASSSNKSGSGAKECLSVIEGGTTVRVNPMASFTQSGKSRKGREGTGSTSTNSMDNRMFTFDKVFPAISTQEEIYRNVSAHVNATVRGYNTTIFAYGSTGSGKTHTMTGNATAPGIIPRAISEIFSIIEATAAREKDVFFYVRMSYVELYNNNFRNLLDFASKERSAALTPSAKGNSGDREEEGSEKDGVEDEATVNTGFSTSSPSYIHPSLNKKTDKIEVRESKSAGIFLAGPNLRLPVTKAQEAFQLINRGNKVRATAATKCNDFSSRSHAILTLHVESKVHVADVLTDGDKEEVEEEEGGSSREPELRLGKMHLVDLAGSERISLSGAEGGTLLETQSINSSLTAIGDVLAALSRNASLAQKQQQAAEAGTSTTAGNKSDSVLYPMVPIPYRNSKLTHLLKDSLGGNSKTIMIATVRNFSDHYQQTVVSLMYASRAKKVKNRSSVNRNVMGDTGIEKVNTEIELLRNRLDERSLEYDRLRNMHLQDMQEKRELKSRLSQLSTMNEAEREELEAKMGTIIHSQAGQISTQRQKISVLQKGLTGELALAKQEVQQKEEQIAWLKEALDKANSEMADEEEVKHLRLASSEWKAQATRLEEDLSLFKKENDYLRKQNSCYAEEVGKMLESKNKILDDILARRKDGERLERALEYKEKERVKASEEGHQVKLELEEVASRYKALSEVVVEQEEQLSRQDQALDSLESGTRQVVASRDEKVAAMTAQRDTLKAENQRLEQELSSLKAKVETTLAALQKNALSAVEDTAQKLAATSAHLEEERSTLKELRKQVTALTMELENSRMGRVEAVQRAADADAALVTTKSALDEVQGRVEEQEGEVREMGSAFSEYLEACVLKMNNMQERHSTLRDAMQQEMQQLRQRIVEHEDENGGPAVLRLKALYEEREKTHKEHHHQQLQRVHDYLGEVEDNLREKLGQAMVQTNRSLSSKQMEYFAVVLARIQKRHKHKLVAAEEARETLEEELRAKDGLLGRLSSQIEDSRLARNDLESALTSLQQELSQTEERLEGAVRVAVEQREQQLTEVHQEVVQLAQREAQEQLRLLREGHADEVQALRTSHAAATGECAEQHEAALHALQRTVRSIEEDMRDSKFEHAQALQQAQAAAEAELASAREELGKERQGSLNQQQEREEALIRRHKETIATLEQAHAGLITESEEKIASLTARVLQQEAEEEAANARMNDALEQARDDAKAELSHWVGTYTAQLDDLEVRNKEEKAAALTALEEKLAEDHSVALEALMATNRSALTQEQEHASGLQSALSALQQSHDTYASQVEELQGALAALKGTTQSSQTELQARLNEALGEQVTAEKKITSLSEQVSGHLQEARVLGENLDRERVKAAEARARHADELTQLQGRIQREMDVAREGYKQQLSDLEEKSTHDLAAALHEQETSLKAAFDEKFALASEENRAVVIGLKADVEKGERRIVELQGDAGRLQEALNEAEEDRSTAHEELDGVTTALGKATSELASHLEATALDKERSQAEAAAGAQHARELEARLEAGLSELEEGIKQRQTLAETHDAELSSAITSRNEALRRVTEVEQELATAKELGEERVCTLVRNLASVKEQVCVLQEAEGVAVQEKKGLEARVSELSAMLEAADTQSTATMSSLREMVAAQEREVRERSTEGETLRGELAQLRDREQALLLLVQELQTKAGLSRSEAQDKADELATLLEKETKKCARLSAQVQGMQGSLTKETLRADSLQSVLTATNEGHMNERLELTERIDEANRRYSSLETQLDGNRESHSQQMRVLQASVRELQGEKSDLEANTRRLGDLLTEKDTQLSLLTSGTEASLEELREQLQQQQADAVVRMQEQHKMHLGRVHDSYAVDARAAAAKIEELVNRSLLQERERDEQWSDAERVRAAKEKDLLAHHREEQTELLRRLERADKDLAAEKQQHQLQLQQLASSHEAEADAWRHRSMSELEAALNKQKVSLTDEHRAALAAKEDAHGAEQEQSVSTALARHRVRETELGDINRRLEEQKNTLVREMGSLRAQYESQMEAAAASHAVVAEDLRAQLSTREDACKALESRLLEQEQAQQLRLSAGEEELRALRRQVESEKGAVTSARREERERELEQHNLRLQEMEEAHAVTVAQSEVKLSEMRQMTDQLRAEAETLSGHLHAAELGLRKREEQAEREKEGWTSQVATLRQEIETANEESLSVKAELEAASATIAQLEARENDIEKDRVAAVQVAERQVESLTTRLANLEAQHQAQVTGITAQHDAAIDVLRQEAQRVAGEAEKQRGDFETSLATMESEYQLQASSVKDGYERELSRIEKKLQRVEWQYEVTTKCLSSMKDKRSLLNEAFEAAGVGEEAQKVVLRDSGADQHSPAHSHGSFATSTAGAGAGDVDGPLYAHYSGYSPYGGGARAVTPFKPSFSASVSPPSLTLVDPPVNSSTGVSGDGSVTDRFIAAILDGDVQGMQAVVRSQGEDLRASYWRGAVHSVQPLHRAISGLQYHGSDQLLLGMLKALIKMGANVNAVDRVGNTPLHKAILVCTSKNVVNVVSALLVKGADPNVTNNAGDAPLHLECRRARLASVYVVGALLNAGASPSLKCTISGTEGASTGGRALVSPLTMVLIGGLATPDVGASNNNKSSSGPAHWVLAAHVLVTACPHEAWEPAWTDDATQRTQLHIIASLFPSATSSCGPYKSLLLHALKHGGFFGAGGGASNVGVSQAGVAVTMCKLLTRDVDGCEPLTILVKRMAEVPVAPESSRAQGMRVGFPSDLLHALFQFIFLDGPELSNSGRAARELVAALVKCAERAVAAVGGEKIDPSSCLAAMTAFISNRGIGKEQGLHHHSKDGDLLRSTISLESAENENSMNYRRYR